MALTDENAESQTTPVPSAPASSPKPPIQLAVPTEIPAAVPLQTAAASDTGALDDGAGTGRGKGRRGLGGGKGRGRKAGDGADAIGRPINMPDRDPDGNLINGTGQQRPPAESATLKRRHRSAILGFIGVVVLPLAIIAIYLFGFAQNQYASEAGFSVRKEENASSVDAIGGLAQLTGSSSPDAEILYDFIMSQGLVDQIDKELDLTKIYGRQHARDPFFTLPTESTIEDKVEYWSSMVRIEYNESSGLIRLQVRAFTPEEAQNVARAIMANSSAMINRLSISAREDATRYARDDFQKAVDRVKIAREAITEFRTRTQVVDPALDIQSQMGVMSNLQGQLAASLIDLDMLQDVAKSSDPRVAQTERRIEVINKRLLEERKKFGIGGSDGPQGRDYASIFAEYERLTIDREVAEGTFKSATLMLDGALAEAQRKSRYLAAHVEPTLAEAPIYPRTTIILLISAFLLIMFWAMTTLIYYSIRDRR